MKKTILLLSASLILATPVSFASTIQNFSNIELGSERTIDPTNEFANMYATPLVIAISKGDISVVKKFIEYGADVNELTNGKTPLMYAARYNELEIVKFLIENGAKINIKDSNNFTAADYAKISNATEVYEYLSNLK